jgi:branched-chain amino acid transport system ATP-binding protein
MIARAGLTRTFQNVRVYEKLTLLENTMISRQAFDRISWVSALIGSRSARDADEAALHRGGELIELVGLGKMIDFPAAFLSYGQKKLLALAMTLMSSPQLIVLDEPLAGVNPTVVKRVANLISNLNRAGQTFIIVEHNVQFIMEHCHKVIVMEQGRKLVEGAPSVIRENPRVLSAYLGKADAIAKELAFHG